MKTSINGINFIKSFEGFRSNVYVDQAGVETIGYGHTGPDVTANSCAITESQAVQLLEKDLIRFENSVNSLVKVQLTQNQFDSLVSFCYNEGAGKLASSTLLKLVNSKDFAGASQQFSRWDFAGGVENAGLKRRRLAEMNMFLGN